MLSGRCCRKELVKEESQIPSNRSLTYSKKPGAGHSEQMVGLPVGMERNEEFTDMMLPIVNSRTVRIDIRTSYMEQGDQGKESPIE